MKEVLTAAMLRESTCGSAALYAQRFAALTVDGLLALPAVSGGERGFVFTGSGYGVHAAYAAVWFCRETMPEARIGAVEPTDLAGSKTEAGTLVAFCLAQSDETFEELLFAAKAAGKTVIVLSQYAAWEKQADCFLALPQGPNDVELFAAALQGAFVLSLALGTAQGLLTLQQAKQFESQARADATAQDAASLEALVARCGEISAALGAVKKADYLAEGPEETIAAFCRELAVREWGMLSMYENTEDWNHINVFNRSMSDIFTVFLAFDNSRSLSRCRETVAVADAIGRRVAVLTDSGFTDEIAGQKLLLKPCTTNANALFAALFPLCLLTAYFAEKGCGRA